MDLIQALRIAPASPVAFVGAGGKSTAMFICARQLPAPVIVTTTTHLAENQLKLADTSFVIHQAADLPPDIFDRGQVVAVVGPPVKNWRVSGLSSELLEQLNQRLVERRGTMLIEADGSRMLPLKAPAEYEPAIPRFTQSVVVTAGLQGLGKPLSGATIHRVEQYAGLSGLQPGAPITIPALAAVLAHPEGGLKGILPHQTRILLLNQADTPELQAAGVSLSSLLLGTYDGVVIAAVQPGGLEENPTRVYAAYQKTAAVILAAGGSERFGKPKQLLDWKGEPFVRVTARTALAAGLNPVVVVCGDAADEVSAALAGLPVRIVENPAWQQGQGSSVRAGVAALDHHIGAAIFFPADKPHIPVSLLRALLEEHARTGSPVIAPMVEGQRTNPVLFGQEAFPFLAEVQGDTGGRAVFSHFSPAYLPWLDSSLLIDVDTDADYRRLLEEA